MISDRLLPALKRHFPEHDFTIGETPQPCAIFSAIHPEVGNIEIHDDGDELTVYLGNFTHIHFSNYEEKLTEQQAANQIVEDAVTFLVELFQDRVVLWGSHKGGGGCYKRDQKSGRKGTKEYVWSGPLCDGG